MLLDSLVYVFPVCFGYFVVVVDDVGIVRLYCFGETVQKAQFSE